MSEWQLQTRVHGSKLRRKAETNAQDTGLQSALNAYEDWTKGSMSIEGREKEDVERLVQLLNTYKNSVESIFDARENSAQEVLQSSILEEFLEYLFGPLQKKMTGVGVCRPSASYLDLVFHPRDFKTLTRLPEFTIGHKDHDFVIGSTCLITLQIEGQDEKSKASFVIPAVALEAKRYLERNMLDECAGTAARVKRATPYCMYLVIAEYLKMDDARPELSRIDEVYVLRRQRNSERLKKDFVPNPIAADLVYEMYRQVLSHLRRIWWDPDSALTTGRLFSFK